MVICVFPHLAIRVTWIVDWSLSWDTPICMRQLSHELLWRTILTWRRHQMETSIALLALLWGETTGHRWIPLTKASDAVLWCFLWSAPEQTQANNRDVGDLRRHHAHYDVIVVRVQSGRCSSRCIECSEDNKPSRVSHVSILLVHNNKRTQSTLWIWIRQELIYIQLTELGLYAYNT